MTHAVGAHEPGPAVARQGWRERFFVSNEYFALWVAQVISATGDWVGLFAITALAASISGQPEAATALVLTSRVAPSFFLAPFMGVLVDRFDRKLLMRIADVARAVVFLSLPFVHTLWGLILASLLLEIFTLLWSPAKEALTPSLVPRDRLTTANSLSLLAAYGTLPFAGLVQYFLKLGNDALKDVSWLSALQFDRDLGKSQALAFYFDAFTFLATAFIVWRFIATPGTPVTSLKEARVEEGDTGPSRGFMATLREIRDGWALIFQHPVLRAVNIGLACGLIGGAMLVPLGPTFATKVTGDTDAFSLYITALGFGVAIGVALLTWLQSRVPKERVFVAMLFFSGLSLAFGVSMSTFWLSAIGVFGLGLGAGAVYVLGFTLLGENTDDDVRGRVFATFLSIVRLCVLGAMLLGPFLSALIEPLMRHALDEVNGVPTATIFGVSVALPGVRITLWFASAVIVVASALAARSMRMGLRDNLRALTSTGRHPRVEPDPPAAPPS